HWWLSTSTSLSNKFSSNKRAIIGHDVWIGAGSIIKQGITIGNGSVIGAMSFVNKDVPENCIVIGSPAKIYRKRFPVDLFEEIKGSKYWEYDIADAKLKLSVIEKKFDI